MQAVAAGACVKLTSRRALDDAGSQAQWRVGQIDRFGLQHGGEVEGDSGRGGVDVDLEDGQHQADGRHRQQQLKQHSLLVPACQDTVPAPVIDEFPG